MINRKNIMSVLMVLTLVFAVGGYAFAAGFSDTQGHWAEGQINKWAQDGLAGGYSDGTFKPNNQITRAEFVAMVNRAFGIDTKGFTADFSDVAAGQWYYNDIAAAGASGYIGGYPDGTFKPKQSISRQEVASIMLRLLKLEPTTQGLDKFKDATRIPQWSRSSIGAVADAGFMAGYPDGTFQPGKSITRAEAVVSLDRARGTAPVEVEDAFLQGTVTQNDKAVADATVRVFKADGYEVIKETETDSKGCYKIALAAGKYDITAATDDSVAYQSDIALAQDESVTAALELVPAAVISGTLYDKNKNYIKNATLLFTTNPTFVAATNNDGKITGVVLPDRKYAVRVYKPGKEDEGPLLVAEDVAVGAAGDCSLGTLEAPFSLTAKPGGGGGGGGGGETGPIVLNEDDIKAGETYDSSRGYKINKFGTFGPASGTATFTTKLTVDPGDSDTLNLQNIKAETIEILSGGTDSVHTKNVKADTVTVKAADGVKIVAGAGTDFVATQIEGETHLAVEDGGLVGTIKIKLAATGNEIKFSGDLSGSTISVEPGQGGTPVINVDAGTIVGKLVLSTKVELTGDVSDIIIEVTKPGVEIIINDTNSKAQLRDKAADDANAAIYELIDKLNMDDKDAVIAVQNKIYTLEALLDDNEDLTDYLENPVESIDVDKLFNLFKGHSGIKDKLISDTGFDELLGVIGSDENIDIGEVLDTVDLAKVFGELKPVISKDDIFKIISKSELLNLVKEGKLPDEIIAAGRNLLAATSDEEISSALEDLFGLLEDADSDTQMAITRSINFTALFDVIKGLGLDKVKEVVKSFDIAGLFYVLGAAGSDTVDKVYEVMGEMIEIMQDEGINRNQIRECINMKN